tara:strand:- start:140 stop:289 length:150 start_codon:yes stop_codon:yes gene_type:complete
MMLTEFLVKSSKLNEIPKPGIKSQLKMKDLKLKIQEFQFSISMVIEFGS